MQKKLRHPAHLSAQLDLLWPSSCLLSETGSTGPLSLPLLESAMARVWAATSQAELRRLDGVDLFASSVLLSLAARPSCRALLLLLALWTAPRKRMPVLLQR